MNEPDNRTSRIHPEMLVGVSAVVIGVCALGISLYETSLMREQQKAAVLPLVELARSYSLDNDDTDKDDTDKDEGRLTLHAENVGIGPARIANFHVRVDGETKDTWRSALHALLRRDALVAYGQSAINGRTIPPGRQVTMFQLRDTDLTEEIITEFERLEFEACFCSVFGECWVTSYATFGSSTPVEFCARDETSFLE